MAHYNFEAKIPVEHVMNLVNLVRNNIGDGGLWAARGPVLKELGCILGELGAYMEPDAIGNSFPEEQLAFSADLKECCDIVEDAIKAAPANQEDGEKLLAGNVMLILQVLNLVRMVVNALK